MWEKYVQHVLTLKHCYYRGRDIWNCLYEWIPFPSSWIPVPRRWLKVQGLLWFSLYIFLIFNFSITTPFFSLSLFDSWFALADYRSTSTSCSSLGYRILTSRQTSYYCCNCCNFDLEQFDSSHTKYYHHRKPGEWGQYGLNGDLQKPFQTFIVFIVMTFHFQEYCYIRGSSSFCLLSIQIGWAIQTLRNLWLVWLLVFYFIC